MKRKSFSGIYTKLISLLLALVLTFLLLPVQSFAAYDFENEDTGESLASIVGGDDGDIVDDRTDDENGDLIDDLIGDGIVGIDELLIPDTFDIPLELPDLSDMQFSENRVIVKMAPQPAFGIRAMSFDLGVAFTEMHILNPSSGSVDAIPDGAFGFRTFSEADGASGAQSDIFVLTLEESGKDAVANALAILNANPDVEIAEPDLLYKLTRTPNDPSFSAQYALQTIRAPQAWGITTGSKNIVVGVIDTGIDGTHPDLRDNLWANPNPNRNGYTNDVHGFNFTAYITGSVNRPRTGGTPFDDDGHGTHISGIIGAKGNNAVGISGVNWDVSLAWLGAGYGDRNLSLSGIIEALNYANLNNIPIVNASWGSSTNSQLLFEAIRDYNGLFVTSAGNDGRSNDTNPMFPANYNLSNLISVASTNQSDVLSSFSNFGRSVHIAAPGYAILSTRPGGLYINMDGTSMATAHVTGVAALILARNSALSPQQLRTAITSTARPVSSLAGRVSSGGVIDAFAALGADVIAAPSAPLDFTAVEVRGGVALRWTAPASTGGAAITGYQVSMNNGGSWVAASSSTGHTFTGLSAGVTYTFRVRAVNSAGGGEQAAATVTFRNLDDIGLFVERLYRLTLDRPSEPSGFQEWTRVLRDGSATGVHVAHGFFFSKEIGMRNLSNDRFVEVLYLTMLDRPSEPAGKTVWVARLDEGYTREYVFAGFANSIEFGRLCAAAGINQGSYTPPPGSQIRAFVTRLYRTTLNREPDIDGLNGWTDALLGGSTGAHVAQGFVFSQEMISANLSNDDFVERLYQALLGRQSDVPGKTEWVRRLNQGFSREYVFAGFANSIEFGRLCAEAGIVRGTYVLP
jgi:subtilisin family serine protease